ncbi:MAG: ankyrin repeat domain-containing protein, partial [Patescibacteria group bacterium]
MNFILSAVVAVIFVSQANAQTVECTGANGTKVIVSPIVGAATARNTHEAAVTLPGKKPSNYQVHAGSAGEQLMITSFMDYDDKRLKLEIPKYLPAQNLYSDSKLTIEKTIYTNHPEANGAPHWVPSRIKDVYMVSCKISGQFSITNTCTGKTQLQINEQLVKASSAADIDSAEQALACGADVNYQNKNGCTPLTSSIELKKEICRKENTPYENVIFYRSGQYLAELYIEQGAYISVADKSGRTALHRAVTNPALYDFSMVELLISLEADLNVQDKDGLTPLMLAAKKSIPAGVHALVKAGADISLVDKKGRSAYDLGEKLYPLWIREMLAKASKEFVIEGSYGVCSPLSIE